MAAIKVLVVDDSVVIRRLVTDVLTGDPEIEVVGTAVNGSAALTKIEQLKPDLVTMDIEMPGMDGIEAVRQVRATGSRIPIIMFSTLTERGAMATLDALAAGATDYVTKSANVGSVGQSIQQVRDALIPRIKSLVNHRIATTEPRSRRAPVAAHPAPTPVPGPPRLRPAVEPPRAGHRLYSDPRVVCTPHTVGLTQRWNEQVFGALAAGVATILAGGEPPNLLNPEALRAPR